MDLELLKQLGIVILLSGLVGLEREKKAQESGYEAFAGIRTFLLIGVFGVITFVLTSISEILAGVFAAGFFGILVTSYFVVASKRNWIGVTSEMAAFVVYSVGILVAMEKFILATVLTLFLVFLLSFKENFHSWVKKLKRFEIISVFQFVLIAFVVLPILPNQGFGPFEFFNPYIIWLMVVFISGISFVSYVAIKTFGAKRGICITGFLSGLVSSTALVLSYSEQSKRTKDIVNPYVVAIVIAVSAMFFRVLIEVAVLNPILLSSLSLPLVAMGVTGVLFSLYYFFYPDSACTKDGTTKAVKLKNPFSLGPALKFGVFFALILFLSSFAKKYFGNAGIYATSVVSGLMDVDAITVSLANLSKDGLATEVAVRGITLATMVNLFIKVPMLFILGARKVAWKVFYIFSIMFIIGLVSLFFV